MANEMTTIKDLAEQKGCPGAVGVRQGEAKLLLLVPAGHPLLGHLSEPLGPDPEGVSHYPFGAVLHREKAMSGIGYVSQSQLTEYSGSPAMSVTYPSGSGDYTQRLIKTKAAPGTAGTIPAVITEIETEGLKSITVRVVGAASVPKAMPTSAPPSPSEDADEITILKGYQKAPVGAVSKPPAKHGLPEAASAADQSGLSLVAGNAVSWMGIPAIFVRPGVAMGELSYHYIRLAEGDEEICVNSASLQKAAPSA